MKLGPDIKLLFKKYLELDTSRADGRNYLPTVKLLANYLDNLGFVNTVYKIPRKIAGRPNRYNLVAARFFSKNLPTLVLYNHIDVVPAEYKDAFVFKEKNGKFFGRGAADHKGGTIALLDALTKIKKQLMRFNLVFWATTDEETQQLSQLIYMTKKLHLPKNAIIFDTDTYAGGITIARLGFYTFELIIKGKSAHSAMSNLGKNPIEDMAKPIYFFGEVKKEYESKKSGFKAFKSSGLDYVVNRCNVTMVNSGIASNTIPETAKMTINCRYIPEENVPKAILDLESRIATFCRQSNINYEINQGKSMQGQGSDTPYAQELNSIYKQYQKDSELCCVLGSCELSVWSHDNRFPHFALGVAGGETNVHGVNEFAFEKDILEVSETLQQFLVSH